MTRRITRAPPLRDMLILGALPIPSMHCDFCAKPLSESEPANLALLAHVKTSNGCQEQFDFLIENLNTSWTRAMSGG